MSVTIQNVFVSSTMEDLESYRRDVKGALELIPASAFLSEDWVCSNGSTETECKEKFRDSDAYLGIFAHWYGSIPPGKDCSITELEYAWAQKRWSRVKQPPIAVFFPMPASNADSDLIDKTGGLLKKNFPGNAIEQENYSQRQEEFRQRVRGHWKTVNQFASREDLAKKALVVHGQWEKRLIKSAQTPGLKENGRYATPVELGQLGRAKHLSCAKRAVRKALRTFKPPVIALLVSGNEDSGVGELIEALSMEPPLKQNRPPILARPHLDAYHLEMFLSSVCKDAGLQKQPLASPLLLLKNLLSWFVSGSGINPWS
jgi:hypothetical protein